MSDIILSELIDPGAINTETILSDDLINVSATLTTTGTLNCNTISNVASLSGTLNLSLPIASPGSALTNMTTSNTSSFWGWQQSQGPLFYVHPLEGIPITWIGLTFGKDTDVPTHTSSELNIYANSVLQTSETITGHTDTFSFYQELTSSFETNTGQEIQIFGRRLNGSGDGTEAIVNLHGEFKM